MKEVIVIDRKSSKKEKEKVMSYFLIDLLYGSSLITKLTSPFLRLILCHYHGVSKLIGIYQRSSLSKKNIKF
jgi:hypothetical protein